MVVESTYGCRLSLHGGTEALFVHFLLCRHQRQCRKIGINMLRKPLLDTRLHLGTYRLITGLVTMHCYYENIFLIIDCIPGLVTNVS